jgi:riboflavin kinase/FMN adenylyltransferase
VAVGTFDGVHVGHQKIIKAAVAAAQNEECCSMVVTFDPHPKTLVKEHPPKLLSPIQRRSELIAALGVDELLVIPFTREFASQTAEAFAGEILVDRLGAQKVFVGFNFHFGHRGRGDVKLLNTLGAALGFEVRSFSPIRVGAEVVSSTTIRELLKQGAAEHAAGLLGRPYRLCGTVVRGEGRGQALGFPTANIDVGTEQVYPGRGVYTVECSYKLSGKEWSDCLPGVANIGRQPTFASGSGQRPVRLEVHLLDFTGELYGAELRVSFLKRLRPEKRFRDAETLAAQLEEDVARTLEYFGACSAREYR